MNAERADIARAVFAVAPQALGGVRLRAPAGPARDGWLVATRALLPVDAPWLRVPVHADDEALLGGLDLAATLASGHPARTRGLIARATGGVLVIASAERIAATTTTRLVAALDDAQARCAVIALDEGRDDDEALPAALVDRLGLDVRPDALPGVDDPAAITAARARWARVDVDDALIEAVVGAAAALGIGSARAALQTLTVTRVVAALAAREAATVDDVTCAVQLVLAPRATRIPAADDAAPPAPPDDTPDTDAAADPPDDGADDMTRSDAPLEDRVVAAARAAIPPGLLALLLAGRTPVARSGDSGRVGEIAVARRRGRVVGVLRGEPRGGARLALLETLRAAAPWQRVRSRGRSGAAGRVLVTRDDLRVQRRVERRGTTTIFAIDASGSQALNRLAETKGAVELLLADCYARRDRVAVIGFRGRTAETLLPPTRSLVRAKRQLAGLPGGGGTPLATGIAAAHAMALSVRRAGSTPLVVLLTDGRANVARDGAPGRAAAADDTRRAARLFRTGAIPAVLIDTAARAGPEAMELAATMGARHVALPFARAATLGQVVRQERDRG